jgi:hypothetical protein
VIGRHAAGVMICTTNAFLVIKKITFIKKLSSFAQVNQIVYVLTEINTKPDLKQVSGEYQGHIIGVEMKFASTGQ